MVSYFVARNHYMFPHHGVKIWRASDATALDFAGTGTNSNNQMNADRGFRGKSIRQICQIKISRWSIVLKFLK